MTPKPPKQRGLLQNVAVPIVTALITAGATLGAVWIADWLSGPDAAQSITPQPTTAPDAVSTPVPALIVNPDNGADVGRCTPMSGVAPPASGQTSYWIATQMNTDGADVYLIDRVPAATREPIWSLPTVTIGGSDPNSTGAGHRVFLIRAYGDRTTEFERRIQTGDNNLGRQLPPDNVRLLDEILVRRATDDGC